MLLPCRFCPRKPGATWFHGLGTRERPNPVFKHAVEQGLIGTSPEGATGTALNSVASPPAD